MFTELLMNMVETIKDHLLLTAGDIGFLRIDRVRNRLDLRELAAVLRARRLAAPFTAMSVQRLIAGPAAAAVAGELQRLADQGFQAEQMSSPSPA